MIEELGINKVFCVFINNVLIVQHFTFACKNRFITEMPMYNKFIIKQHLKSLILIKKKKRNIDFNNKQN